MGKRGHGLVFGGGATGMMGAAARGVAAENGYILGIAPRFFDQPGVLYEKCTEFIFTENMRERKKLLEEKSDATIVAPGGIGTYEEFFEIFTLKSLKRIDRPIVLYNIDGYYDKMKALLEYTAEEKFMDFSVLDLVVFLDEPTAVLTPQETARLFEVIRNMKADNKSVIIITHKLHEVLEISDRVAILRKGEYIGTVDTCEATENSLTEMMVGKKVELNIARSAPVNPVKRLSVSHLTVYNREDIKVLDDVSFDVYGGEILGIAGISGNGQKELLEAIAGLQITGQGSSIEFYERGKENQPLQLVGKTPKKIRDAGVHLAFVPEDRLGMGLVGSMGMTGNMLLKSYGKGASPLTDMRTPKKMAEKVKEELEVVTPSLNTPVSRLSGGNVQKVLVGREIAEAPTVLMTAYAVRGLDINTSYTIYNLLDEEKKEGVAVVYVGEDLDVLIDLCDRILVLCGGKENGILDARTTTKEEVGLLMTNLRKEGK